MITKQFALNVCNSTKVNYFHWYASILLPILYILIEFKKKSIPVTQTANQEWEGRIIEWLKCIEILIQLQ